SVMVRATLPVGGVTATFGGESSALSTSKVSAMSSEFLARTNTCPNPASSALACARVRGLPEKHWTRWLVSSVNVYVVHEDAGVPTSSHTATAALSETNPIQRSSELDGAARCTRTSAPSVPP